MELTPEKIYTHFKGRKSVYQEKKHCQMLIKIMMNRNKSCMTYFCVEAMIAESTFWLWLKKHELFRDVYSYCKMVSKQLWYEEGLEIKNTNYQMGTINYAMDHWKLIGWAKFGISKNSKIRLDLKAGDTPAEHYASILEQAASGDFTASEFKQLMEAVNVGLNVHQVFELQKQIDALKSDMGIMKDNTNVDNPFSDKGIEKKD